MCFWLTWQVHFHEGLFIVTICKNNITIEKNMSFISLSSYVFSDGIREI